jgi:hypothetical protein
MKGCIHYGNMSCYNCNYPVDDFAHDANNADANIHV